MKVSIEDFSFFGTWPGIFTFDNYSWQSSQVNKRIKEYIGIERRMLICEENQAQHYFGTFNFMKQLRKFISSENTDKFAFIARSYFEKKPRVHAELTALKAIDYTQASNSELVKRIEETLFLVNEMSVFDQIYMIADKFILEKAKVKLEIDLRNLKEENKLDKLLPALTLPTLKSSTLKEEENVLKLALQVKKLRLKDEEIHYKLQKEISELVEEFGVMPGMLFGKEYDFKHYLNEVKQASKKPETELKKEYEKLHCFEKTHEQKFKALTNGLRPITIEYLRFTQLATHIRNEAEMEVALGHTVLKKMLSEIQKRTKIDLNLLRRLTPHEIKQALSQTLNVAATLEKRKTEVYYSDLEREELLSYGLYFKLIEISKSSKVSDSGGLMCANPGEASGHVRIVNCEKDVHEFKNGEVLISYSTCVDYLPAMKKASAIITENGGITCHAAVVAREFEKPCIIGMKNATTKFKTGDLIHVNATKCKAEKIARYNTS